tara:strand:- start:2010 stop:2909 length:900 start_codon:yes stop_codon:yes gene_type:complete
MSWFDILKMPKTVFPKDRDAKKYIPKLRLKEMFDILEDDPAERYSAVDVISGEGLGVRGGTGRLNKIKDEPYYQIDVIGGLRSRTIERLRDSDFFVNIKKMEGFTRYEIRPFNYIIDSGRALYEPKESKKDTLADIEVLRATKKLNAKFQEKADKIMEDARAKIRKKAAYKRIKSGNRERLTAEEFGGHVKDFPIGWKYFKSYEIEALLETLLDVDFKTLTSKDKGSSFDSKVTKYKKMYDDAMEEKRRAYLQSPEYKKKQEEMLKEKMRREREMRQQGSKFFQTKGQRKNIGRRRRRY